MRACERAGALERGARARAPTRSLPMRSSSICSRRSLILGLRVTSSRKICRPRSYTGVFFCAATYVRSMYMRMSRIIMEESLCLSHLSLSSRRNCSSLAATTSAATDCRWFVIVSVRPAYSLSPNLRDGLMSGHVLVSGHAAVHGWLRGASLVQHHVVRVAVELLEAQAARILPVDLAYGIVKRLPCTVGEVLIHLLRLLEGRDDELREQASIATVSTDVRRRRGVAHRQQTLDFACMMDRRAAGLVRSSAALLLPGKNSQGAPGEKPPPLSGRPVLARGQG